MAPADREASDSIAWAHLSDFHFRADKDYGRDEVLGALLEDLRVFSGKAKAERGAEHVPLDFVVVTGDIAFSGKAEEFEAAGAFFREVSTATDVPLERFFLVPGNHDVDRAKGLPAYMGATVSDRDKLEELWRNPAARRAVFGDNLAAYRTFAMGLNPGIRIPEEQPGGFCHNLDCNGRSVALLGLGSSWLCGSDEEYGKLITGKEQAYDLAGGVGLESLGGADLKLALMHHPLDWMQEFDKGEMPKLLADKVDVLVRGHLHGTGLEWQATPGRELRAIAAGSAYAGSQYRNAYNVVRVLFGETRQVKVWLRAYAIGEKRFVKDVETYAQADDGTWTWELPGRMKPDPRARPARISTEVDVRPYLEKLREENRWLDIRGIGAKVAERTELERVYTRLRVAGPGAHGSRAGEKREPREASSPQDLRQRDLELHDLLQANPNMVLVGDPGAGKTTFLRFVALNLAQALLGEEREQSMRRIGLTGEPSFPVVVSLGRFGQFLREHPDTRYPDDSPAHLHRYLDFRFKGFDIGLPEKHLRRRLRAGGCMLLLDGLDEVPGDAMRKRVGAILDEVVGEGRERNRHLVTCRTRAYQGQAQLGAGFSRYNLVDFGPDEIDAFVTQWSRTLHRVAPGAEGSAAADRAADYRRELLAAIAAHPHVRPLTTNPLMLTILAVVHWSRKKLPEQRADLYDATIEYLLESRQKLSAYKNPDRKACLQAIALRMFENRGGVRKSLGRAEAAEAVQGLLKIDLQRGLEFVEDEELYSGILVSRLEGEVEFWHPTFAEYLAALALALQPVYWDRIRRHLFEERWSEVVLLLAGCRRRVGINLAAGFIRKILRTDSSLAGRARAVGLVGRILRDILPYGEDPTQGTGYQKALHDTVTVFEKGAKKSIPEKVRVEVGEALGQAGDPRLVEDDHANRVLIRGSSFWMGAQKQDPKRPGYDRDSQDSEAPVHRVTLSDFHIDRYPVTVQQFNRFVDGEGYPSENVWSREGWAWKEARRKERQGGRIQPSEWEEQLRHPNRPVVGVTWYEAEAYCLWLSLKTRRSVRLPTEAQWEFAARGEKSRMYPWGNEPPTDRHANFESRIGHATPVGIYLLGATPEGVQDLAGNVWEWCGDWYGEYRSEERKDPTGTPGGGSRVLRSGGFDVIPEALRAAWRVTYHPAGGGDNVGFRCVVVGAAGQTDLRTLARSARARRAAPGDS
jgi:formylglycine-generating enzyme required for sulfatase activity/predicted phosphodiesterase